MPQVNPQILVWARETAGLTQAAAAKALGFKDGRYETAISKLDDLETGSAEPTSAQLQLMAQKYRRSLLVFYLEDPPPKADRGQDFRTVFGSATLLLDPTLDALIRDFRTRQLVLRSLLEEEDGEPIPFVGSAGNEDSKTLSRQIIDALDFRLDEFRARKDPDDAFAYLREKIEARGVFVLLAGNLGSYHSNIPADVFRGYALADAIAPLIVINDQDAHSSWSFTALHELAHIWKGATGISGDARGSRIEQECDEIASQILIPFSDIVGLSELASQGVDQVEAAVATAASTWKVSRKMIAYRLFQSRVIDAEKWAFLSAKYKLEWEARKVPEGPGEEKEGGPSYYTIRRHRLGQGLLNVVHRGLGDGLITPTKAARVLGINPRSIDGLMRLAFRSEGR